MIQFAHRMYITNKSNDYASLWIVPGFAPVPLGMGRGCLACLWTKIVRPGRRAAVPRIAGQRAGNRL